MASEVENASAATGSPKSESAPKKSGMLKLALAGIGVICLAGGCGLLTAKLTSGPAKAEAASPHETEQPQEVAKTESNEQYDYYEMESITVNLNEPRLARWVRVIVMLAIENGDKKKSSRAKEQLEGRKNELRNWLTVFLAGCSLEEVRGAKNLNRLQREVMDSFNQQLWPDQKPMIHHVLFKEFAVQ